MIEKDLENAVVVVHPYAPYRNKESACGLSFFKRREYRRNCREFLDYAKESNFLIFHFRDVHNREPPLKKSFGVKPDLEINLGEEPVYIPIRSDKKFNLYVLGAYAGSCVKTAVESLLDHKKSLSIVLDCIVPKHDDLLASEYPGKPKLWIFQEFDAKEILHK